MSSHVMMAWLFGKLPTHGDFVSRGLTPAWRDRLDVWLSAEMVRARDDLGEWFDQAFDSAPPWRVAVPVGNNDDRWFGGALSPSVDAVGRRFPLIVAFDTSDAQSAVAAARQCENAIYRAYDERLTADELCRSIGELDEATDAAPIEGWWTEGNLEFPPASLAGMLPQGLVTLMLSPPANG